MSAPMTGQHDPAQPGADQHDGAHDRPTQRRPTQHRPSLGGRVSTAATDVGLLVGRVVLGVVFIAHGWQKWSEGIGGTQEGFAGMGVPAADAAAVFQATAEVAGGVLLIVGLLTLPVGLVLGASMLGAAWYAHRDAFMAAEGGYEFVVVLAAFSFLLALVGPGRLSLDGAVLRRLRRRRAGQRAA